MTFIWHTRENRRRYPCLALLTSGLFYCFLGADSRGGLCGGRVIACAYHLTLLPGSEAGDHGSFAPQHSTRPEYTSKYGGYLWCGVSFLLLVISNRRRLVLSTASSSSLRLRLVLSARVRRGDGKTTGRKGYILSGVKLVGT